MSDTTAVQSKGDELQEQRWGTRASSKLTFGRVGLDQVLHRADKSSNPPWPSFNPNNFDFSSEIVRNLDSDPSSLLPVPLEYSSCRQRKRRYR